MSDPIVKCQGCGYMGVEGVEIYGGVCQSCGDPDYKEREMKTKIGAERHGKTKKPIEESYLEGGKQQEIPK